MTKLFPKRSRHELKLKFKKEEKTNLKLVDKAMTAPVDFDFKSLEEEMSKLFRNPIYNNSLYEIFFCLFW
jgi:transcription factor TFIIIB component B''